MPADPSMQGGAPMEGGAPADQMGGEMAAAGGDEQAMVQQLAQIAQQIVSKMGPEAAAMLAQIIMEMLQGGGGPAPVGEQPEGEPVFKKGGKICGRMRRGAKMKKCGK